jgi:hypothetical protein
METVCPNCKRRNEEDRRYCAFCGVNLGDAAPKDAHHIPHYETPSQLTLRQWIARWLRGLRTNPSHD